MTNYGLDEYKEKRDLEKSGEPAARERTGTGPLVFVVQKHRARQLHYDLRLEIDGVLKSWAVPKGPSLDPIQKRLAAMVEDHPLDYADFEGAIPKGEYGAGEVIIWDNGIYSPDNEGKLYFDDREKASAIIRKGIEEGKLSIFLKGKKLKGSFTLIKTKQSDKSWLLIKHRDEFVKTDCDILDDDRSVVSRRTLEDIRDGIQWEESGGFINNPGEIEGTKRKDFPGFILPMLASLTGAAFSNPDWSFEPKLDGYRTIATLQDGKVSLWSRNGNNVTDKYSVLVPAIQMQKAVELILDGEIVAIDINGHISFECLQQYLKGTGQTEECRESTLVYYVFDLLYQDGYDLRGVKYGLRRQALQKLLHSADNLRLVEAFKGDGKMIFEAAVKNGLEGVIAKKTDSLYHSGKRSQDWLKVKATQNGDFIVAGYTEGEGTRSDSIGALILGYRDKNNTLTYAGHVGTGFNEQDISDIKYRLEKLITGICPLDQIPDTNAKATWVHPELVVEVKYSQWTSEGRLRAPVFIRIRDDKSAQEINRDQIIPAPAAKVDVNLKEEIKALLEQLNNRGNKFIVKIEGNEINISNPDKVLWPNTNDHPDLMKLDFLKYLAKVSPYVLPHLKNRPLTLSRYPDGINGEHFWQRHWNQEVPDFVTTINLPDEQGKQGEYLICNNLSTLIWLGQVADIEFHTWFSRTTAGTDILKNGINENQILDYPDFIIFDLDPYIYSGREARGDEPEYNREAFRKTCGAAQWVKEVLDSLSLAAYIKTSGKTGLHIYVPIVRELEYGAVRRVAETIGQYVMQKHPEDITMEWSTEKRKGKIFIDYAQNVRGKTLASIYSPRPNAEACVSFPLHWGELGKSYPSDYTIVTAPNFLDKYGDLWAEIISSKSSIKRILEKKNEN
jgi:bifunctional non-homologous end joining protein LigD